ncbi:MAG: zinc ribbon domain-containing protein [Deltaproteobacteria bacterium]|nr:zinc ribbon domain-containing protein [Deltaproteobacteria bacterium]
MPIYEYECSKCGRQVEVWQKFSDKPLSRCEVCKGRMKKLISQSTFHLKGTGWYVTDYASSRGKGSTPKRDREGKSKKEDSGGKKAEASGGQSKD